MLSNHLESILYSRWCYSSSGAVNKIPVAPDFSRTAYSFRVLEYREYYVNVEIFSSFLVLTLSHVDFARPISQIVFHMKCNRILLSYFMDDSFCSILFDSL